jgi:hypothetical protein
MDKFAKQIDPEAVMELPDKPPGIHWSKYNRLAECSSIKITSGRYR